MELQSWANLELLFCLYLTWESPTKKVHFYGKWKHTAEKGQILFRVPRARFTPVMQQNIQCRCYDLCAEGGPKNFPQKHNGPRGPKSAPVRRNPPPPLEAALLSHLATRGIFRFVFGVHQHDQKMCSSCIPDVNMEFQ